MEYDDNCIGDGGLKAMFSDGTITSGDWQCKTVQYGPTSPETCLFGGEDWDSDYYFSPPNCKYNTDETLMGSTCTVNYYNYSDDWYATNFSTCSADGWYDATEYTDAFTGWGVRPSDCTEYICPEDLDWSVWSESGEDARFDFLIFF